MGVQGGLRPRGDEKLGQFYGIFLWDFQLEKNWTTIDIYIYIYIYVYVLCMYVRTHIDIIP